MVSHGATTMLCDANEFLQNKCGVGRVLLRARWRLRTPTAQSGYYRWLKTRGASLILSEKGEPFLFAGTSRLFVG